MPRRKIDRTEEYRVTLGEYERKMMDRATTANLVKGLALPAGIAAIGVGMVFAGMAVAGLLEDYLAGLKGLLNGADSEKRQEVNQAIVNDPAISENTPPQWEGMSVAAIYEIQAGAVNELLNATYGKWLGDAGVDNSTNWAIFKRDHGIGFTWGDQTKRITLQQFDASMPAAGENGEVDYSSFAYQISIRETAARRQVAWKAANYAGRKLIELANSMSDLDWTSRWVDEAGGFSSDALLWAAWGRTSFQSITGLAGASIGYKLSEYETTVERSFIWETEMWDFYSVWKANPTEVEIPSGWLPKTAPVE